MKPFSCATLAFCLLSHIALSQSVHQTDLDYYNSLGNATADYYESLPFDSSTVTEKVGTCNLNKMVYGWHPYWVGNVYQNYDWNLLSHLSFFSYEVNYLDGTAVSSHGFSTSAAVTAALASGNTKVTLCVTLFANHASFLTNTAAKQTLISNLISTISARGAHGVNIDFEGLPASQATNFANFMVDLANQMHAAIPGSEVSTVLYSVDWNSVFNFSIMEPEVDYYIIMGYDYYYSGSSTAGPNDPLYQFGTSYNYTLSRSITDYLEAGCLKSKLILGLPYYGREWSTSTLTVPSGVTASGVSRTYNYVRNNSTGFYSTANHTYENDSQSDMYLFMNGATPKQCFITEETAFRERLQHVLNTGIGGIGIWTLGYDDGYAEFWNAINDKLTDCYQDPCSGTIHDFGGATKNYYNNEDYTWTIAPPNATSLDVSFSSFDVETNYDYLYIYDGNSTAAPQIPGSPFTGTVSPGTFSTSTGAVTFRFTSDISTVKPGFFATYTCNQDDVAPTSSINVAGTWQTAAYTANYTDADNNAVQKAFSLVTDDDGFQRSGNRNLGYLHEDFSSSLSNQWTTGLGAWALSNGAVLQSSETESNSACNTTLTQSATVVYHFKGTLGGTGTNRRAGIHFYCSDASLPNRGNSYLVYWRVDTDKCQIYRSTNDNLVLQTNDDVVIDPNVEYDFKVLYSPATGLVQAFVDDVLVSSWTDPSPLTTGNSLSFRSGNATFKVDDVRTYLERGNSQTITIGSSASMVRYQNQNPLTPSAELLSLVVDNANNFSAVSTLLNNIDWTSPAPVNVNDGLASDVAQFVTPTEISANWTTSSDPHSGIVSYEMAVGTSSGAQNIVPFTAMGTQTFGTINGLSLTLGQTYYITVRTTNGAGLTSVSTSNGQLLQAATVPPLASFTLADFTLCEGDSMQIINTSQDASSYVWTASNGTFSDPSAQHPYFVPTASGTCQVTLLATNSAGNNSTTQTINVVVLPGPIAAATPDATNLSLPNAVVLFANASQNATIYQWNFGDGESSTDVNPWHQYTTAGSYTVSLIALSAGCSNDTTFFTINVGNAGIDEGIGSSILVYPSPFGASFKVKCSGASNASATTVLELVDLNGKRIPTHTEQQDQAVLVEVPTSLARGVYLLRVQIGEEAHTIRLIHE
jgi:spore germination protein YaaH/PKD repeat protein